MFYRTLFTGLSSLFIAVGGGAIGCSGGGQGGNSSSPDNSDGKTNNRDNGAPTAPDPAFEIERPRDGAHLSKVVAVSVDPHYPDRVEKVKIEVSGSVHEVLEDGPPFEEFLDADQLGTGDHKVGIEVTGRDGETLRKSVDIHIETDPPKETTLDSGAAVLGTESGDRVRIGPGNNTGAKISVREVSTLEDPLFGAVEVESSKPVYRRIEPVLKVDPDDIPDEDRIATHRSIPGTDGARTITGFASEAPGNYVVPNAPERIAASSNFEISNRSSTSREQALSGTATRKQPENHRREVTSGDILNFNGKGLNLHSDVSNKAVFRSENKDVSLEAHAWILDHPTRPPVAQVTVPPVPPMPEGNATITLKNTSTGETSEPIPLHISPAPSPDRPSDEIIDQFFLEYIEEMRDLAEDLPEGTAPRTEDLIDEAVNQTQKTRENFEETAKNPSPEQRAFLDSTASAIHQSGVLGSRGNSGAGPGGSGPSGGPGDACLLAGAALGAYNIFSAISDAYGVASCAAGLLVGCVGKTAKDLIKSQIKGSIANAAYKKQCGEECTPTEALAEVLGAGGGPGGGEGYDERGVCPIPVTATGCGNMTWEFEELSFLSHHGSRLLSDTSTETPDDLTGRFRILVTLDGDPHDTAITVTDSSGYFYLPLQAEKPFTVVAMDTKTGRHIVEQGEARSDGKSTHINLHFSEDTLEDGTITWTGDGRKGRWFNPRNWSPQTIPDVKDTAVIDDPDADVFFDLHTFDGIGTQRLKKLKLKRGQLTIAGGKFMVAEDSTVRGELALDAKGTLIPNGSLEVTGKVTWEGGEIGEGEGLIEIGQSGVVDAESLGGSIATPIENAGTMKFRQSLKVKSGGEIRNLANGVVEIGNPDARRGDNTRITGTNTMFVNEGKVRLQQSQPDSIARLEIPFENQGTVDIFDSKLIFADSASLAGTVSAGEEGRLEMSSPRNSEPQSTLEKSGSLSVPEVTVGHELSASRASIAPTLKHTSIAEISFSLQRPLSNHSAKD